MNVDELTEKIKIAHEAVKNESEPYKLESFKIILDMLMHENITHIEPISDNIFPKDVPTATNQQLNAERLAKNCNISMNELKNVISIEGDKIELLLRDKAFGDTEIKQRINASQVILIAYEIIFETEWIKSSTLLPCLKNAKIMDPHKNLSHQLPNQTDLFRKKPNANEYKLTSPQGQNSAYEIIGKLAKGEKIK